MEEITSVEQAKKLIGKVVFIAKNILLEKELIKLIDFGNAKQLDDKDNFLFGKSGTQEYMPPEMYKNNVYNGKPVDIWCLGLVLYNIIYDTFFCRNKKI